MRQKWNLVVALLARLRCGADLGVGVGDGYLGFGNRSPGLIDDRSGNGPLLDLRRTDHQLKRCQADRGDQASEFLRHIT